MVELWNEAEANDRSVNEFIILMLHHNGRAAANGSRCEDVHVKGENV